MKQNKERNIVMAYLQIVIMLLWHTFQLLGLCSQRLRFSNKQLKSINAMK